MMKVSVMAMAVLLLAACGEKIQTNSSSYKPDEKAWQSPATPFSAKGYKAGNQAAWEAQMRERIQTQNEYQRVN
jgi:outer membrane biogenesis lipoprotein LolB